LITRLDYEPIELLLHAETEVEQTLRAGAVKKEPETVEFIESIPKGSAFYDVGANVGSYTLIACALGLQVVAFEPSAPNFIRLRENLALNSLEAFLVPDPLWDTTEVIEFVYSSRAAGSALHSIGGEGTDRERVLVHPLDWWVFHQREGLEKADAALPIPEYLKIDTDGYEDKVLQGAEKTLRTVKALQVETDDTKPDVRQRVYALLQDAGFTADKVSRHHEGPICNVLFVR
jgi:FkbM family methyltransferase